MRHEGLYDSSNRLIAWPVPSWEGMEEYQPLRDSYQAMLLISICSSWSLPTKHSGPMCSSSRFLTVYDGFCTLKVFVATLDIGKYGRLKMYKSSWIMWTSPSVQPASNTQSLIRRNHFYITMKVVIFTYLSSSLLEQILPRSSPVLRLRSPPSPRLPLQLFPLQLKLLVLSHLSKHELRYVQRCLYRIDWLSNLI